MVVKEDGTKWACQSCLKGHRVSGCTHTDRELTLVPKKGRPVTQCQHCRLERKKRSAHVKCDCGEAEKPHHPKEKCIHLREAEERAKSGSIDELHYDKDPAHLAAVAEEQGCCCLHGGKCSCSLFKKEQDRSRADSLPHGPAVHKPRLESTRSESSIKVYPNGHQRPVHRKNNAAHDCGMPYKMPLPRAHTEQNISAIARRSVDSLALDGNPQSHLLSSIPHGNTQGPNAARLSKSEYPSPQALAVGDGADLTDPKLSSADFTALGPIRSNNSIDYSAKESMAFPQFEPMSATADSSYDPWSNYPSADTNLFPDNNPFGAWATTFDGNGNAQPALTAASSGTQSEIDEIPPMDDFYGFSMPSIQEDDGTTNFDSASGENTNINRHSLPPNFFKNADFNRPFLNEWNTSLENVETNGSDHQKKAGHGPSETPAWSPSMTGMSHRSANVASAGRQQSQSVGHGSAPGEDIMNLFPEINYSDTFIQPNDLGGLSSSTSDTTADLTAFGDDTSFNTQSWADGSVSVPNDDFSGSFTFDADFSNWQQ